MRSVGNKKVIVLTGILTIILMLCYKVFNNSRDAHIATTIIFIEERKGEENSYKVEKEMILNDCAYYFDYSAEKRSVLYLDDYNKIIEKNIITNDVQEIKISDICKEVNLQEEFMHNFGLATVQYRSDGQEMSFALDNTIFNYDINEKKLVTKVENIPFYNEGRYIWTDTGKLYYTIYEHPNHKLYVYEANESIPVLMYGDVCNFVLSENEEKIYFISNYVKSYYGFGFELGYELGESSLKDKKISIYDKYNSGNCTLKYIDNTYLYYVSYEKNFWGTKVSKVYCMELESGKSRCIYKTYNWVSDIIVESLSKTVNLSDNNKIKPMGY